MRGEKEAVHGHTMAHKGSPPHARGKAEKAALYPCWHRITPACAGKSMFPDFPCQFIEDHPRMRGEKT